MNETTRACSSSRSTRTAGSWSKTHTTQLKVASRQGSIIIERPSMAANGAPLRDKATRSGAARAIDGAAPNRPASFEGATPPSDANADTAKPRARNWKPDQPSSPLWDHLAVNGLAWCVSSALTPRPTQTARGPSPCATSTAGLLVAEDGDVQNARKRKKQGRLEVRPTLETFMDSNSLLTAMNLSGRLGDRCHRRKR